MKRTAQAIGMMLVIAGAVPLGIGLSFVIIWIGGIS